jgi:hypothetical protein
MVTGLLACAIASGCGPERGGSALERELEPHCGEASPRLLMPLGPNEQVGAGTVRLDGDRYVFTVYEFATEITDVSQADYLADGWGYPHLGSRVVSVDACGDDARVVAEGLEHIHRPIDGRGPWIGCDLPARQLHVFDPRGAWPSVSLRSKGCLFERHDADVVYVREDDTLVRASAHGEQVSTQVLLDGVALLRARWPAPENEHMTVLTLADELFAVDASTGGAEVLREGVTWVGPISADGRFLVWGDGTLWENPRVLDRVQDVDVPMGRWDHDEVYTTFYVPRAVSTTAFDEGQRTHLVRLPDLREVWLDGLWRPWHTADDGVLAGPRASGHRVPRSPNDAPAARLVPRLHGGQVGARADARFVARGRADRTDACSRRRACRPRRRPRRAAVHERTWAHRGRAAGRAARPGSLGRPTAPAPRWRARTDRRGRRPAATTRRLRWADSSLRDVAVRRSRRGLRGGPRWRNLRGSSAGA